MIIVLLVLLSICLLQVSHAVPHLVWRAAADYLFLRAKGGFPAGMIMGQETLAASCPFSLYIYKVFVKIKIRSSSKVLFVCLIYEFQANAMAHPTQISSRPRWAHLGWRMCVVQHEKMTWCRPGRWAAPSVRGIIRSGSDAPRVPGACCRLRRCRRASCGR